jgi:hypothetical protein
MIKLFWTTVGMMAIAAMLVGGGALFFVIGAAVFVIHWSFLFLGILPFLWMAMCSRVLDYAVERA